MEPISGKPKVTDMSDSDSTSMLNSVTPETEISNGVNGHVDTPANNVSRKKVTLAGNQAPNVTKNESIPQSIPVITEQRPGSQSSHQKKLCASCEDLDLKPDKFLVKIHASHEPSSTTGASGTRAVPQFSYNSSNTKYCLGEFGDLLRKSSTCNFCSLVVESIKKDGEDPQIASKKLRRAKCFLNWEIDGRSKSNSGPVKPRTRRIHIQWSEDSLGDAYLVFVAQARYANNSDAKHAWRTRDLFLGRDIGPRKHNEILIKSWLDLCSSEHGGQCIHEDDEKFDALVRTSYFGVVDVLDMCLTPLPYRDENPGTASSQYAQSDYRHAPYVALSYVWGEVNNRFKTTSTTILQLREQGALESQLDNLPQVIVDAIQLTRRLGLRYLWVDSLCIVQGSARSWKLNAQSMDLIYGNALLTICAADGNNADAGLVAFKGALDRPQTQLIKHCAPGVQLMVSKLAETRIKDTTWNSRAWVFQERMLSKRCLIFAEGNVFFQCRSAAMSEEIVSDPEGSGWSLDLVDSPSQLLRDLEARAFWVYASCVPLYSSRHLTRSEDVLAAFDGVANCLKSSLQAPFVFGLPSSHFDLALLWEPQGPVERRWDEASREERDEAKRRSEFPSWSWCGWIGATIDYKHPPLFENAHEWLSDHTWISWYIRDGHGDLRPLWDDVAPAPCSTTEERWKGYGNREVLGGGNDGENIIIHRREKSPPRPFLYRGSRPMHGDERRRRGHQSPDRRGRGFEEIHVYNHPSPPSPPQAYDRRDRRPSPQAYDQYDRYSTRQKHAPPAPYSHAGLEAEFYYNTYEQVHRERKRQGRDEESNCSARVSIPEYGRRLDPKVSGQRRHTFHRTVPESPYRVNMTDYRNEPDKEFPDHPLLQFYTWSAELHVIRQDNTNLKDTGLCRYNIADDAGDWCGTIVLDSSKGSKFEGAKHEFLAISEAKYFTQEECDTWTYYIPKQRQHSEWDVYYVILLEKRDMISYRVGLGKVFKAAFFKNTSEGNWKEVVMG